MLKELNVNGFINIINFDEDEIEKVHIPIIKELTKMYNKTNKRIICLYAAPPGTGKSTRGALWEDLSKNDKNLEPVKALSIDGFHYEQSYLETHFIEKEDQLINLKTIKGSYETYDVDELINKVKLLKTSKIVNWPFYDRNIHNPVKDKIEVQENIILIEGNWVLRNLGKWSELKKLSDFSIYHDANIGILKSRLIERKIRGGSSIEQAEKNFINNDLTNIQKVKDNHFESDVFIDWNDKLNRWCIKR
jgi:hypothetical protein